MNTGRHDVGFSFMIPPNVPSSLDGQYGFIRYKLKAKAGGQKSKMLVNIISGPNVSPSELYVSKSRFKKKTTVPTKPDCIVPAPIIDQQPQNSGFVRW